jgi:hypothetical protein
MSTMGCSMATIRVSNILALSVINSGASRATTRRRWGKGQGTCREKGKKSSKMTRKDKNWASFYPFKTLPSNSHGH